MQLTGTEQVRVYADDKAEIERVAAALQLEQGARHTFGDVVKLAKLALYSQRPDLQRIAQTEHQPAVAQ